MATRRPRLLAAALGAALAAAAPGTAQAAVIGFDDLGPGRVTVNAQYAAQGVTFGDVMAVPESQYVPGFSRSPTHTAEVCFAIEFCTATFQVDFTAAQRRVQAWVGLTYASPIPVPVTLTALDGNGATVRTATATLPAASAAQPVRTPLEVALGAARVRRIVIGRADGTGAAGIAVDDVEFSRAGPPPPCPATAVPTVSLSQPVSARVVNDSFVLQGLTTSPGAPVTSATLTSESAGPTRTAALYPTVVHAAAGAFGPIRVNGMLSPGKNTLSLRVSNCKGESLPAVVQLEHAPIPAGTGFALDGIEIVQTVQGFGNGVPLIAASGAGVKRTVARVYLRTTGPAPTIPHVTATLVATRADGTPVGGPLSITTTDEAAVDGGSVTASRHDARRSLEFELPAAWLGAGRIHLEVGRILIEGAQTTAPCSGCANLFAGGQRATVTLHRTPPFRLVLVTVPYRVAGSATPVVPSQLDIDLLLSWLRRAYPASDLQVTQLTMGALAAPPTDCHDVNAALARLVATSTLARGTKVYGLVDDDGGSHFMRGCASIGGTFGSGPTGGGTFGWDLDGSYGDWYAGHEIGHTFGRTHPGFCGESSDDDDFPYPNGATGSVNADFVGLDVGDAANGIARDLRDWQAGWHDVMTYCENQWVSQYTYSGILRRLCADGGGCPTIAAPVAPALRAPAPATRASRPTLSITGSLDLDTGRLALGPLYALRGVATTPTQPRGGYAVELRGGGGQVLVRHAFAPQVESDESPQPVRRATLRLVVPFPAGARSVVVRHGAEVLATRAVSASAPTVRILAPRAGARAGRSALVRWAMADRDGDALRATVLYAPDGRTFAPVAADVAGRSLRVDLRRRAGGPHARFRVIVTDGVRTATATSGPVRTRRQAPVVRILTRNVVVPQGAAASLLAQVTDALDRSIPPRRLVWRSGGRVLGRGLGLSVRLRPGVHVVTLTARSSTGGVGRASTRVTVRAPLPAIGA